MVDGFVNSVIQDTNELRLKYGNAYTTDQIIELVKIAELRKIASALDYINRNTFSLKDIERSVDNLSNDADDLKEALVREGQGHRGGPYKYACMSVRNLD